ncbi:hypothetical protein VTO42DRAFT_3325 [Malbranchea cinnamomea]
MTHRAVISPARNFDFLRSPSLCRWNSTFSTITNFSNAQDTRISRSRRSDTLNDKWKQEKLMEERAKSLERNRTRNWKSGDIYSPHDLSPSEMKKWRQKRSPSRDAFDALGLNPLHQYKNFAIMSEYMTEMGRIRHRSETGLRPVNQRRIAKAIRRAIGLGLMPSVYRHPEILLQEGQL